MRRNGTEFRHGIVYRSFVIKDGTKQIRYFDQMDNFSNLLRDFKLLRIVKKFRRLYNYAKVSRDLVHWSRSLHSPKTNTWLFRSIFLKSLLDILEQTKFIIPLPQNSIKPTRSRLLLHSHSIFSRIETTTPLPFFRNTNNQLSKYRCNPDRHRLIIARS